ncbi:helix-turn-helix domain-containing protein [Roseitalea porphyridii]|uniref:XRE family transcriptional regulator n=1 Tax=Roseitalea porphyridii TaxID=1852022 RepID=A0A4P6V019_9HYPH|nr:helix-turn-helix domain-containing protein [Roseitalea porphyridii]QBK30153.1 XRE family transcriptional regulator [Roseitalea porphyridii]
MKAFGQTLKAWRSRRRMSQMALALAADVSTRHISYLETSKAAPSRDMALRLAEALNVPAHARNDWLTAAGFAPIYESRPLDSAELAPFMEAVTRLLDRHDPYPGWALDPDWRIVLCNRVGETLLRRVGIAPGDSLVAALVDDPTLGGALLNWREATLTLSQRLGAEARRRNDAETAKAAETLAALSGQSPLAAPASAAVTTRLGINGRVIELVSIQAAFNTANDLTLADLRTELFFPVGADSERNLAETFPP